MTSSQLTRFAASAASMRAQLWPVVVTLSTDTASPKVQLAVSGAPVTRTRQAQELRAGYVQRTLRTFCVLRSRIPATASIALGTEFTIITDPHAPGNVGTTWRVFELTDSNAGAELRCVCFRLDN